MTTHASHSPNAAIVVAVDGSPESASALGWALRRAEQLDCPIRAVTAYPAPTATSEAARSYWTMHEDAARAARRRARRAIDSVDPYLCIPHLVQMGSPHEVLANDASDSRMIVVGTRARNRWWHRFRPSLTNRLTGLVNCPVISVPPMPADPASPNRAWAASA